MKKTIKLFLVAVLLLTLFASISVFADSNTVVVDGVTFSKNMKILIKYPSDKTDESYTIPDTVTIINDCAFCEEFRGNEYLKNVVIPSSVKTIGSAAFFACPSLTSVTIPDSVTTLADNVFSYCTSLTSITIPDSVTSIANFTFSDSVTKIGIEAFSI